MAGTPELRHDQAMGLVSVAESGTSSLLLLAFGAGVWTYLRFVSGPIVPTAYRRFRQQRQRDPTSRLLQWIIPAPFVIVGLVGLVITLFRVVTRL